MVSITTIILGTTAEEVKKCAPPPRPGFDRQESIEEYDIFGEKVCKTCGAGSRDEKNVIHHVRYSIVDVEKKK